MGNNLFGIGFGELIFIAILVLIVFGPKRIPEVARTIGRLVRQVRQATSGVEDEMRRLVADEGEPYTWLEGSRPLPPLSVGGPQDREDDAPAHDATGPAAVTRPAESTAGPTADASAPDEEPPSVPPPLAG